MQFNDIFKTICKETYRTEKEQIIHLALIHNSIYIGYDRLSNKNNFSADYISLVPPQKNVSLEEAIQDSANQLSEIAKTKKLALLLSGGIDSTLVFYAMLRQRLTFTVVSEPSAIKEYVALYKKLLWNEYPNVSLYLSSSYNFLDLSYNNDTIFVTGEIGDQTIGSMVTMELNYEIRTMSMKDAIEKDALRILTPIDYPGNFTQDAVSMYHVAIEWFQTDLKNITVAEFLWALNFIYKYLFVIYRLYVVGLEQYGENKNCYHFYDTIKFQQYAMSHYKENCAYIQDNEYKQAFKDWIYSQNHDEDYRINKLKVPSLMLTQYWNRIKPIMMPKTIE